MAPTQECIALLAELDAPVEHIVLPTTLFEHKIFVGPFQRRFPEAETWIAPDQWSWPVNLPPAFFVDYVDAMTDGLGAVLLVRGSGQEVVTKYG